MAESTIYAIQDENQFPGLLGHTGTAGTADLVRVTADINGRIKTSSQIIGADAITIASVEARKQTPTGNALNVQIGPGDVISNIPVVTLFEHHQVHEGESY